MKISILNIFLFLLFSNVSFGQNYCDEISDDIPDCIFVCDNFSSNSGGFSPDTPAINTACMGTQATQWLKFLADQSTFTMRFGSANCALAWTLQVEIFDANFNSVSDCISFKSRDWNKEMVTSNLVSGEAYFILIKEVSGTSCNFQFFLDGHFETPLGDTPDLIVEPFSTLKKGEVYVPNISNVNHYVWRAANDVTLYSGSSSNRVKYENPENIRGQVCLTPVGHCGNGSKKCIDLPETGCPIGSEQLPGCLVECPNFTLHLNELSTDAFRGIQMDCFNDAPIEAYWFSLIAEGTELSIEQKSQNFRAAHFQIFDKNLNPVSDCQSFKNQIGTRVTATNLTPGETYSVCVGSAFGEDPFGFIKLNIYGNSSAWEPLPPISFTPGSRLDSGGAFINPNYASTPLIWYSDKGIDIVSGQGTTQIQYKNGRIGASLKVKVSTQECGTLEPETAFLPGAFPSGVTGTSNTACRPANFGENAGNEAPGCLMCGPIYQGSTEGYTKSPPDDDNFPCGTIENNQFISVIADTDGTMAISLFAGNCSVGCGLEMIIYDQNFNPVSNCHLDGCNWDFGNYATLSNLNPGEIYWIMIDGINGAICDFLITVQGAGTLGEPDPAGTITANPSNSTICPGAVVCYTIDPVPGATEYEWDIPYNSNIVSTDLDNREICLEYLAASSGSLSVYPKNACQTGNAAIIDVLAFPIQPTFLPPEIVCLNDFPLVRQGQVFTSPGIHDIIYQTRLGCDSVVKVVLIPDVNPSIQIDTTICFGSCIQIGMDCFDETGNYTVTVPNSVANGCDSSIILNLTVDPNTSISSDFRADANVCINSPVNINFIGSASGSAIFDWNFNGATILSGSGAGPYQIAFADAGAYELTLIVTENGCSSVRTSQTVVVNDRLSEPIIGCQTTLSSVNFFWSTVSGAVDYSVDVLTGQSGTLNGTEFTVTGLLPDEEVNIEVSANSASGCAAGVSVLSCSAQDCPPRNLSILPVADFCIGQNVLPIQLTVDPAIGAVSGSFIWSGAGVSPSGLFDPNLAGVGTHQINLIYDESSCIYQDQIQIIVNAPPTADFNAASNICLDENLSIQYTGNATSNAIFNWNFGGGNIITNSGSTNYEIGFPSTGDYTISLSVEENGCVSTPISKSILVENPLSPPIISCISTANSVTFSWNNVAGADSYSTTVFSGQTGVLNGTEYTINNLSPGEFVDFELTANSSTACPNVSARTNCSSLDCPLVSLDIPMPATLCEGTEQINLNFNAFGGTGSGNSVWSGMGISGNILDISGLVPGDYQILLNYSEGACDYTAFHNYKIAPLPTVSSEIISPIWYPGTIGSIDLTGSGGTMPYSFAWSNGTTTEDLIDVNRGQLYCVTLTDAAGCSEQDCYEIGGGIFRINPIVVVCRNEPKRLSVRPSRGANFKWSPATDLSCNNCASPTITTSQSGFYDVTATLFNGRNATTRVFLLVLPPGFCNSPRINDLIDEKLSVSELDFQNMQEEDLINFEKEITEVLIKNAVSIAPNPSSGIVNISSVFEIENAEVFDFSGRNVFSKKDLFEKEGASEIDLSNLAKGVYFIKIKTGGKVVVKRVVLI